MHRYCTLLAWQLAHGFSDSSCWCGCALKGTCFTSFDNDSICWCGYALTGTCFTGFASQFCHILDIWQVLLDSWILHSSCYAVLMAETRDCSDCDLSQMRMFDGSDFAAWWECMCSAYTQRDLHGPLSGDASRPRDMSDDQWQELDELALSTLCLHLRVYLCSCYAWGDNKSIMAEIAWDVWRIWVI